MVILVSMIDDAAAVVTSGGRSSRMGRDKSWLAIGGRMLLQRVVSEAAVVCRDVLVVARAEQSLPPLPTSVLRVDDPPERKDMGPFAAVLTGLEAARERGARIAFITACDMPFLSSTHVAFMLGKLTHGVLGVVPVDGLGAKVVHGLAGAVVVDPAVEWGRQVLGAGESSMRSLYAALRSETLPVESLPDPRAVRGCNTLEEWEAAQRELR